MNFFFIQTQTITLCDFCKSIHNAQSRYCSDTCRRADIIRSSVKSLTTCKNCSGPIRGCGDFCSDQCGRNYHANRACANCKAYAKIPIYDPYCSFECRNSTRNQINRMNQNNRMNHSYW